MNNLVLITRNTSKYINTSLVGEMYQLYRKHSTHNSAFRLHSGLHSVIGIGNQHYYTWNMPMNSLDIEGLHLD
jgi:hypothetical protein